MRINFGILGAGRISKIHCHNIYNNPKAKILKIYDINNKSSESLAKKYKTYACKDEIEIFKDSKIDAIVIGSSTPTHIKYLELANKYNKDVSANAPTLDQTRINDLIRIKNNAATYPENL